MEPQTLDSIVKLNDLIMYLPLSVVLNGGITYGMIILSNTLSNRQILKRVQNGQPVVLGDRQLWLNFEGDASIQQEYARFIRERRRYQ